jgi:hypothetical protein
MSRRSISLATWIISSSEGVIRPDRPRMSACSVITVCTTYLKFPKLKYRQFPGQTNFTFPEQVQNVSCEVL